MSGIELPGIPPNHRYSLTSSSSVTPSQITQPLGDFPSRRLTLIFSRALLREAGEPEWGEAIAYLTERTAYLFAGSLSHYRLRHGLIERHFGAHGDANGKKLTLERLAELCEIHRQTVSTHHQKLVTWLRGKKGVNGEVGIQAIALQRADELLRERGFVWMEEAA